MTHARPSDPSKMLTRYTFNRDHCRMTLLGMSGVGKTYLARRLPRDKWFHFSGDYRIGTKYLAEPMNDDLKRRMIGHDLWPLLQADHIYLGMNITFENLAVLSDFLGWLGNPARKGMKYGEFIERQRLFKEAEIAAMRDVPTFIDRARNIYNYPCFINDAGGSLCEIMGRPGDLDDVTEVIIKNTLLVYIEGTKTDERALQRRAMANPKPLFFGEDFLDTMVRDFCQQYDLAGIENAIADDFYRWVFPRLVDHRRESYRILARAYGVTITTEQLAGLAKNEESHDFEAAFLDLIEGALESTLET